ncbi:TolC family protein [Caenimonas sedimenti]|uniref:TolC family protein n=1 Tax=Caenimonas sedimenti TaxID=2596921 RepID=A0A562ZI63_9BURK|nr:TolC family protein [Caenimonas sedimenti]TWO67995.1 TolC family protein [Caenimonas sedimenti]
MRFPLLALASVLCAAVAQGQTLGAPTSTPLTLGDAIRLAEVASPALRAREAQLASGEGLRQEAASLLANNPELGFEQSRKRPSNTGESSYSERTFRIAQPFETGGQQGRRREAAAATLEAIRAEIDDARNQARTDAALRFNGVLVAQRRVLIEQRSLALFDSSSQAVARRRAAGEDTRLDANVALIEAERARNALAQAREQLLDARTELATVLQLPPAQLPEVAGDLGHAGAVPYSLDQLLLAVQTLPRQKALAAREAAARARLGVEQASRSPDLTVGLDVGREGPPNGREQVATLSLSLPLPIFKRNSAAIGQAMTDLTQAEIERATAIRDGEAQVRRLWLRLASQRDRVQRLQQAMVPASADNQQLATRSRQAGQIGLLDQLLVNRQALDAERELNDALNDFHTTRIELERAAGWPPEGTPR